jgi:hypothetical protein
MVELEPDAAAATGDGGGLRRARFPHEILLHLKVRDARYLVCGEFPYAFYHLQIWRRDKKKVHSWTDLQRIKTEIVGAEAEGMELYPAESRVVNQAHVYHLWVVTGVRIPIGPRTRMVKGGR